MAREFLYLHAFLQVGRVGSTTENITQIIRWVEDQEKRDVLMSILREHQSQLVLVFVEKKRDADYLERYLCNGGFPCTSIHGDRVQREREEALALFKCGRMSVLVATDVASRGLDIPDVAAIIQYDLPTNVDDYVHRIGRTGRAGKKGTAIAFFNEKNKNLADDLVPLLAETGQEQPPWLTMMVSRRPHHHQGGAHRGRGGFHQRGGGTFGQRGGGFPSNNFMNRHIGGVGGQFGAPPQNGYHPSHTMNPRQLFQPRHQQAT